ncbi:T-complex protein 1 subunit eta [Fonticula alba]|uniref:T-complex protein 1 subunit eta n=1 Tax=Fonticula alba TaxID=691883 RepID=A0A058ZEX9_FONAL|nr:T-complex protein 1 subunit eta [Fonticula alba]KCV72027.1 T-complex protein 1 subunit eta [Fonticula alba]|eukprot:XP_009493605.1 T-complex protein 1 subunit eta [Fonticula alba]
MLPMQPQIILLKEGTDQSQGRGQLISNINACQAITDTIRTTLGPRGMDKLMVDSRGTVTITNDGATIMGLLDIVHPAARTLVDIARSQDAEVGDGTTSVVLVAGELLREAKPYVEENVPAQTIIRGAHPPFCGRDFFKKMVVDAILMLDSDLDNSMIGMKRIPGGSLQDTQLIAGVAFKKAFSYAGFEQQPKRFENPKILCLNVELELKAERDNADIRIDKVEEYQKIVDAEWKIIYDKLEKIVESGAQVVLSKLPIGDLATQFFADRNIFCAGRIPEEDLQRTISAVGGALQSSVSDLKPEFLGTCALFEESQVGGERYNIFTGCPKAKSCTFLLRGGADQFIEEVQRSLHDSLMIVKRTLQNQELVAGGGATEMTVSRFLRDHSRSIAGKQQLLIAAYARALEIIPRQLCDNAGFDSTDVLNQLRQLHGQKDCWFGVDINNEGVADMFESFVWEPSLVKINYLRAATEAACLVLSIDETIRAPGAGKGGPGPMAGMM